MTNPPSTQAAEQPIINATTTAGAPSDVREGLKNLETDRVFCEVAKASDSARSDELFPDSADATGAPLTAADAVFPDSADSDAVADAAGAPLTAAAAAEFPDSADAVAAADAVFPDSADSDAVAAADDALSDVADVLFPDSADTSAAGTTLSDVREGLKNLETDRVFCEVEKAGDSARSDELFPDSADSAAVAADAVFPDSADTSAAGVRKESGNLETGNIPTTDNELFPDSDAVADADAVFPDSAAADTSATGAPSADTPAAGYSHFWLLLLLPVALTLALCALCVLYPQEFLHSLSALWQRFSGDFKGLYVYFMLAVLVLSLALALSPLGRIRLATAPDTAPRTTPPDATRTFGAFSWMVMIFSSVMAADLLYYALIEWSLYARFLGLGASREQLLQASVYSLFHWGASAWSLYLLLSAAIGYFVYNLRARVHRYGAFIAPACPRIAAAIDVMALFALFCAIASAFGVSIPLLSALLGTSAHDPAASVLLILAISVLYSLVLLKNLRGIELLAKCSIYIYACFLLLMLAQSDARFSTEQFGAALWQLAGDFAALSVRTSAPAAGGDFTATFSVFYWAYWICWAVATPFFIAQISHGKSLRFIIIAGLFSGVAGTYVAFWVLSGFSMQAALGAGLDFAQAPIASLLAAFDALPFAGASKALLAAVMVLFYASTLDGIVYVLGIYLRGGGAAGAAESGNNVDGARGKSGNSADTARGKSGNSAESGNNGVKIFYAIFFALLPSALLIAGADVYDLFSISVLASVPALLIYVAFLAKFFWRLLR